MTNSLLLRLSLMPVLVYSAETFGSPQVVETCRVPPLLITRADVWTPDGILRNRDVLVRDGRIASIGTVGKVRRPSGAEVVDAHGNTLIPGLIDGHAHLFETGGPWPAEFAQSPRENVFPITARQALRSGVTSARTHLFDRIEGPALKGKSLDDCYPAPRLQIGAPGLMAGATSIGNRQFTGYTDLDDARQKLALARKAGADWIALHSVERFPQEELGAIATEAKRLGLRILAAGDSFKAVDAALDIQADSLDYLPRDPEGAYSEDQLERMNRLGITAVPPIGYLHRHEAYLQDETLWANPLLIQFMPPSIAEYVLDKERFRKNLGARRQTLSIPTARFQQLRAAGITIAAGTDSGSPANFHADAIWWELDTYRKLGAPPNEAIAIATVNGSKLLRDPDIGTIRVGARGDLVLYHGRVDSGAFDVKRVLMVAKGGKLFVRNGRWIGP
jgi:imidazolonepropionase-like amidohydrolase